jgi:hypothetical protein
MKTQNLNHEVSSNMMNMSSQYPIKEADEEEDDEDSDHLDRRETPARWLMTDGQLKIHTEYVESEMDQALGMVSPQNKESQLSISNQVGASPTTGFYGTQI